MSELLTSHGFRNVVEWFGGVDTTRFVPGPGLQAPLSDLYGRIVPLSNAPILLYVGRVSKEKNLDAFLEISNVPGIKVVVGDGSALSDLMKRYPDTYFVGRRAPADLPALFQSADVFVFPSKTDTFGRVIIEALACGTPVAAFPVTGPRDILNRPHLGALHTNLSEAIQLALANGSSEACIARAQMFSTDSVLKQFLSALAPIRHYAFDTLTLRGARSKHQIDAPRKLA
jgi:glycosyltransferase involved in cell wall biosynthesis